VTPFTAEHWSVDAGLQMAFTSGFGPGLTLRFGHTLAQNVYFGIMGDYWFASASAGGGGVAVSASASIYDAFLVGGWDWSPVASFVVRPFGGGGFLRESLTLCIDQTPFGAPAGAMLASCTDVTYTTTALTLGGQALYRLSFLYIGGELRGLFAVGGGGTGGANSGTALAAALVGMTF
jgi:hypothetical protein